MCKIYLSIIIIILISCNRNNNIPNKTDFQSKEIETQNVMKAITIDTIYEPKNPGDIYLGHKIVNGDSIKVYASSSDKVDFTLKGVGLEVDTIITKFRFTSIKIVNEHNNKEILIDKKRLCELTPWNDCKLDVISAEIITSPEDALILKIFLCVPESDACNYFDFILKPSGEQILKIDNDYEER
jgi:hypothetical protein